ncbi:fimbrial protein, partial [Pseudomonas aeruginosa]
AYGLNAMFIPASNTTLSSTDTLLAKDNPTVGIRLLNEDRSVISIGKEFEFIPYTPTQTTVTKNFLAQLRWMTSRPILGPFNATAA